jgi:hypothetical protein
MGYSVRGQIEVRDAKQGLEVMLVVLSKILIRI